MLIGLLPKKRSREMRKRLLKEQNAKRRERLAKLVNESPFEE